MQLIGGCGNGCSGGNVSIIRGIISDRDKDNNGGN